MQQPIDEARAYLRQQREMYGDALYVDHVDAEPVELMEEATETEVVSTAGDTDVSVAAMSAEEQADWQEADSVAALEEAISGCLKCPLGHTRTRFVFGSGNPDADIMIIGEAPGADEDAQGLPFVGRAGQLLTKILEAIQLSRDEVFICNILKCRPPNNRKPLVSETDECEPYLWKQIELIRPRFILAVGLTAANTLL